MNKYGKYVVGKIKSKKQTLVALGTTNDDLDMSRSRAVSNQDEDKREQLLVRVNELR